MGGNALKSFGSTRISPDTYHIFKPTFISILNQILPESRIDVPTSYHNKPDFGDLDVVVENNARVHLSDHDIATILSDYYQEPVPYIKNGPVTSFGLPTPEGMFQVDLIYTPSSVFDYAVDYYSWNDVGNLVGRIAHKFGLKHGHDGLQMVVREDTNVLGIVPITLDYDGALEFLGFSSKVYRNGFSSIESIYEFVVEGKYFNPDVYALENRNHTARVRDRKRPTYTGFLKYCEALPPIPGFDFPADKSVWIPRIFEAFPSNRPMYDEMLYKRDRAKLAKVKLNGALVREWLGVENKQLGRVMVEIKTSIKDVTEWAIATPSEKIKDAVIEIWRARSWE